MPLPIVTVCKTLIPRENIVYKSNSDTNTQGKYRDLHHPTAMAYCMDS